MTTTDAAQLDQAKLDAFVGRFLGERLGLYQAMADGEPVTPATLASLTGTTERYVAEWLAAQAAAGYVAYDATAGAFRLPPEHAALLVDRDAPVFTPGASQLAASGVNDEPMITEAFRTGEGVAWHAHHPDLFVGCERFFRPGYAAHLTSEWLPALEGVEDKLRAGARVADIGCGHGASTIIMARAYPASAFTGFDYHDASIDAARRAAEEDGLGDRVSFQVAAAQDYPGSGYDLVTSFDCLYDMGDPVGAARHVLSTLAPDGTWMIVEPYANDRPKDNLTPVGKIYYSASTLVCTPASRAQELGLALGAQAGESRMRDVVTQAGFGRFRRAAETPVNIVYEARP
jgi:SAM-dependent methyltransferase